MQLSDNLLEALGFVEYESSWADEHTRIYKNQLPATLEEFKNILTGAAYNKGKKAGIRSCNEESYTPATGSY